jgi:hypothetical protein
MHGVNTLSDMWNPMPCFADGNKMLYYFKSPDDVQKPNGLRGTINMADCVVEDLDERGAVRAQVGRRTAVDGAKRVHTERHWARATSSLPGSAHVGVTCVSSMSNSL